MSLTALLTGAQPGATIILPPGPYGPETVKGLSFSPATTIDARAAILTDIELRDCAGLRILGGMWGALRLTRAHDVSVSGAAFVGPETAIPGQPYMPGSGKGIAAQSCDHLTVSGSTFTGFAVGIGLGKCSDAAVTFCDFAHMSSDGIDIAQCWRVKVEDNTFHDTRIIDKEHPDAIQMWSRADAPPTSDIEIRRNRIVGLTQGINGFDGAHPAPDGGFDRLTIEDNFILTGQFPDAIYLVNARDSTVRNNRIETLACQRIVAKLVFRGGSVTHYGNTAGAGAGKPAWADGPAP